MGDEASKSKFVFFIWSVIVKLRACRLGKGQKLLGAIPIMQHLVTMISYGQQIWLDSYCDPTIGKLGRTTVFPKDI